MRVEDEPEAGVRREARGEGFTPGSKGDRRTEGWAAGGALLPPLCVFYYLQE